MVNLLDDIIGELVNTLKAKNMYDNTLIIVTSDNGASPDVLESAGSNFPLRGGKYTSFEGGIRALSFASGG